MLKLLSIPIKSYLKKYKKNFSSKIFLFKPNVCCITNITEDHLERYKNKNDYFNTIVNVVISVTSESGLINNYNINLAYIKDCSNLLLATQPKIPKEHIKILGNIFKSKNKKIQTPFTLDNIVNVKIVTYN